MVGENGRWKSEIWPHIGRGRPRWVQMVGEDVEWEDGGARGLLHACKQSGEISAEEWSRRLCWTYGQGWASKCALERERFEGEFQRSRTMMHSWYLGEEELRGLRVCEDALRELPVLALMGIVARSARLVKRLVLMLDHARVVAALAEETALNGEDMAVVWEHERDRCIAFGAGYANICYCLVLNTQLHAEHSDFLNAHKRHPKQTKASLLNRSLSQGRRVHVQEDRERERERAAANWRWPNWLSWQLLDTTRPKPVAHKTPFQLAAHRRQVRQQKEQDIEHQRARFAMTGKEAERAMRAQEAARHERWKKPTLELRRPWKCIDWRE